MLNIDVTCANDIYRYFCGYTLLRLLYASTESPTACTTKQTMFRLKSMRLDATAKQNPCVSPRDCEACAFRLTPHTV